MLPSIRHNLYSRPQSRIQTSAHPEFKHASQQRSSQAPHHPAPKLKMTIVGEIGIVQVQIQALKLRVETAQEKIAKLDGYIASTDKSLLEGGDDAVVKEREDIRKNLHTCTQDLKNFVAGTLERDLEKLREMEQKMQALESRING